MRPLFTLFLFAVLGMSNPTLAQPAPATNLPNSLGAGKDLFNIQYRLHYVIRRMTRLRHPPYACFCYGVSGSAVYPGAIPVWQSYNYGQAIARRNVFNSGPNICPSCAVGGGGSAIREGARRYYGNRARRHPPRRWVNRGYQVPRRRIYRQRPPSRSRVSPGATIFGQ